MSDLKDIVKRHSMKHYRTLRKICAPLDCLDIPVFSYYRIDREGEFAALTNDPEPLDYYYSKERYLLNPYLSDPRLFRSGYTISPFDFDPDACRVFQNEFDMHCYFILLQRRGESIEAFLFANHDSDPSKTIQLLSKIDLLHTFASYFRREAKSLIAEVIKDRFNLKKEKKEKFQASDPSLWVSCQNSVVSKFMKDIAPLSQQEWRCLELFKQGYSSQATASILKLSMRTVEYYFENIKSKLGCSSKWDLLQW